MKLNGNSILELSQKSILSEKQIDNILKDIYKGSEGIPAEMYATTRAKLSKGVTAGYGTDYDLKDVAMVLQLKKNVAVFSAFKANHYQAAMHSLLLDEKGKKRSFDDFRTQAQKLDPKYNQIWLEAEYNMAIRQARSAKQWLGFEKDKDVYPNLEYMPSQSATPSEAHKKHYGIILPISDPFWDTAMPPSRWNCKCWVKQTKVDSNAPDIEPQEKVPGISGNSGKTKMIFDASHAYMQNLSKLDQLGVKKELNNLRDLNNEVILFKVKNNAVIIHVNADESDLIKNVKSFANVVKKYGNDFYINKHSTIEGIKNPEGNYRNTIGDRSEFDGKNLRKSIQNTVSNKLGKSDKKNQLRNFDEVFILFDLAGKLKKEDIKGGLAKIKGCFKQNKNLKFIILENNDKTLIIESFDNIKTFEKTLLKIEKELL